MEYDTIKNSVFKEYFLTALLKYNLHTIKLYMNLHPIPL